MLSRTSPQHKYKSTRYNQIELKTTGFPDTHDSYLTILPHSSLLVPDHESDTESIQPHLKPEALLQRKRLKRTTLRISVFDAHLMLMNVYKYVHTQCTPSDVHRT